MRIIRTSTVRCGTSDMLNVLVCAGLGTIVQQKDKLPTTDVSSGATVWQKECVSMNVVLYYPPEAPRVISGRPC